ncbi:pteridine-dependent deoxygenase like protein [Marinicella litoralis]|uniref:Chorismatase FkbO/Hyg5-like N-terminal domain-containing protein n=1 Tax=Marinicella litoralis TaxID=644220 RepID=A0A4V3DHS5_9GAMM|nr:pteridine-dependent deoxygenase like protein [Marinicella litoralis]TDR19381.1 hypothetical protein C8D91_1930 [Marinicella litoralis]
MTFKYLPDHSHQANVAILPLEVLCRSAGYSEYWIDGAEVSLLKTDSGGEMTSQNHLAVIYNSSESNIETVTKQAYEQAFQSSKANRCTHLIRTWNYLHDINGSDNGLERYQSFCVARHEMLEKFEQLTTPNPAATAIGSHNGENVFVFLFAKQAGHVIENKRQVSAWEYPKKYAPKQPRFSRAMKYGPVLMCSGTASVVGHETLHLNDVLAQLDECLKNVSVLLSEDENKYPIQSGLYRFYLREVEHAGLVEAKIIDFGIENYIVLHGDVCRENLLIECEVVFQ